MYDGWRGARSTASTIWVLAAATTLTSCLGSCASGTNQPASRSDLGSSTLNRIGAPTATDTIEAQPAAAYVLAVINADDTPVVGTAITFGAVNAEIANPGEPFAGEARQATDSRGEVAVLVRFGRRAGLASISAYLPTARTADTLTLEVRAGRTVGPVIQPADTLVPVGAVVSVVAYPADRLGNRTGMSLPLSLASTSMERTDDGFRATGIGEARFSTSFAGSTVTAAVGVVPDGEIAYTTGSSVWLSRFDGTDRMRLPISAPPVRERSISWSRDGGRLVLGGNDGFVAYDLAAALTLPARWPGLDAGSDVLWPRFGPDGVVHYSSADGRGAWDLRRMDPEGASPRITVASDRFPNNDLFPDWHPDGTRFVFTADWEQRNRFLLRISNPAATAVTTIFVEGTTPVWSPDGSMIAYQENGNVGVVSPDGAVSRSWGVGWAKGVTWSPDGAMLVGLAGGHVVVLDVETGATMTLTRLGAGIGAVAWRPTAPSERRTP